MYPDIDQYENSPVPPGAGLLCVVALIVAAALLLSSCTIGYADAQHTFVNAVGGRGAAKSKHLALTWDNEKSFNDAAILGALMVPAIQAVKMAQSADKLAGLQNTNATKQAINATNAATTVELGAQGVTKAVTLPK